MKNLKHLAQGYYTSLGEKNIESVKKYLHPDIQFSDPQETVKGRDVVLQAAKKFSAIFNTLSIRTILESDNQAAVVYEVDIPLLEKKLQAVSLLSFQDGLIAKIELFYDSRGFSGNK